MAAIRMSGRDGRRSTAAQASYSVVTARSTSTLRRPPGRRDRRQHARDRGEDHERRSACRPAAMNTKPSSASGRETITANAMPSTMPSTAPIAAVITDSAADHPPHLAARHADRAQQAELARALVHRQRERVDDAEQRDDHRQRQQRVDSPTQLVDLLVLLLLERARSSAARRSGSRSARLGLLLQRVRVRARVAAREQREADVLGRPSRAPSSALVTTTSPIMPTPGS